MKTRNASILEDIHTTLRFNTVKEWSTYHGSIGIYQASNDEFYVFIRGMNNQIDLAFPSNSYMLAHMYAIAAADVAGAVEVNLSSS